MGERKAQTKVKNDEELWGLVSRTLVAWSMRKHRLCLADAEEVVQEAIRQFLKAGGVADPADPPRLVLALGSRVNGVVINRRRKKALAAVELTADGEPVEPDHPENPEQRVVRDDMARKAVGALLDRVAGDELASSIVMQIAEGVEEPADQANILGRDIRDVYNARRRLKTHVEAIETTMEDW